MMTKPRRRSDRGAAMPTTSAPILAKIPASLARMPHWVAWSYEKRDGKWTKVPRNPATGQRASTTDPKTWGSYNAALKLYGEQNLDGIGYVFTQDDPYTGIDLDKCRNPKSGKIKAWARQIVEQLDSYSEVSPSGTGIKIIIRAKLSGNRKRKGNIEMYDRARFFTITGRHVKGTPATVNSRQKAVDQLYSETFPPEPAQQAPRPDLRTIEPDDNRLIRRAMAARNGERFRRLWAGETGDHTSPSEADLALCTCLAFWAGNDRDRIDRLFRRSGLYRAKWNRSDYRDRTIARAMESAAESREEHDPENLRPTHAELLVALATGAELFLDDDDSAFASFATGNHTETWPVKSNRFKNWLSHAFYQNHGRPPAAQAVRDAIGLLEARAENDGNRQRVFLRVAEHTNRIFIDLCNEEWQAVEITAAGWKVRPIDQLPVKFRRARGMKELPIPQEGGSINELRDFPNVESKSDWILIVAWLVGTLHPVGPFPLLVLHGEQGSAKSTTCRVIRGLIDPNFADLRAEPRNERDLMIAARNAWLLGYDNLSWIPSWLSNALCRLATGGGFSTRQLYSDHDEVIFSAYRPVLCNGINELATQSDLLDRAIQVSLPVIPASKRKTEKTFYAEFERARPRILGALYDAIAAALVHRDGVQLNHQPRMADFAIWIVAAASKLPFSSSEFQRAYEKNRSEADFLVV